MKKGKNQSEYETISNRLKLDERRKKKINKNYYFWLHFRCNIVSSAWELSKQSKQTRCKRKIIAISNSISRGVYTLTRLNVIFRSKFFFPFCSFLFSFQKQQQQQSNKNKDKVSVLLSVFIRGKKSERVIEPKRTILLSEPFANINRSNLFFRVC